MSIYKSFAEERNALLMVFEDFIVMREKVTELVEEKGPNHVATVNSVARMEAKGQWLMDEIKTASLRAVGGVL